MKIYIIAGEASGDLHAASLAKAMNAQRQDLQFRGWGGELMVEAGVNLVKHYRDLAFMGFTEVVKHLPQILRNFSFCKKDITDWQPDMLILVDYPGFNLRIARWAHQKGIKVIYYISPQIWAWHTSRVHQIVKNTDKVFVVLPFEKEFYARFGYEVEYEGHPLADMIDSYQSKPLPQLIDKPIIALLPGSRTQEILRILPIFMQIPAHFPEYSFVIAGAPSQPDSLYEPFLGKNKNVHLVKNATYDVLSNASAALVASGTATLETALFKVPQVVCYRGSKLSYWLARRLIKVPYISLVNLIADKPLIKELIQDDMNEKNILDALSPLLQGAERQHLISEYDQLRQKLGTHGVVQRIAKELLGIRDKG